MTFIGFVEVVGDAQSSSSVCSRSSRSLVGISRWLQAHHPDWEFETVTDRETLNFTPDAVV